MNDKITAPAGSAASCGEATPQPPHSPPGAAGGQAPCSHSNPARWADGDETGYACGDCGATRTLTWKPRTLVLVADSGWVLPPAECECQRETCCRDPECNCPPCRWCGGTGVIA